MKTFLLIGSKVSLVFYAVKNGNQTGIVDSILFLKSIGDSYTALLPELSYDYDANGNIIRVYENDIQRVRYYYDGLNRLVREDNNYIDKTITYCYDKCGDILSKSEYALTSAETLGEPVNTVTYSYTDANFKNAVTQYGDDVIVYDASGNPTSYRGYTMTWAKGRQLASLSGNGKSMSFKYDNAGIRTSKTVSGVETKYTYLGGTLVSQKTGDEVINFAYSAGGAPYGFSYNGQSYFYLLNLQGDVIGIYDGSGNIVVRYTYDSWGKVISVTGSLADTVGVKNPLRYRGYYYDVETKLYYLQSRYYDPETCRFINADSLLVAGDDYIQGVNMFAYCQNNPVMYSDPSGREATYHPALLGLLQIIMGAMIVSTVLIEYQAIAFTQGAVDAGLNAEEYFELSLSFIDPNQEIYLMNEHRKRGTTNRANLEKHQQGQARKKMDKKGGEKGDKRRPQDRSNKKHIINNTNTNLENVTIIVLVGGTVGVLAYTMSEFVLPIVSTVLI